MRDGPGSVTEGGPDREAVGLALARRRFLPFVKETFPQFQIYGSDRLVAERLERFERQVAEGVNPRLMIFKPPRTGKSELVSRRFPGWVIGRHPDWNLFLVSYGADLAEDLSGDARRVVQSDAYGRIFGREGREPAEVVELDPNSKGVAYWRISGRQGGVHAVGVGGALTGRGFNIGIVDDPTKGRKEADSRSYLEDQWTFYKGTFYMRGEPGSGIIIMATRWATRDLPGRLLAEMGIDEDTDKWEVLSIPAEAEPGGSDPLGRQEGEWLECRFSEREWLRLKANTPRREWLAQFQQRPTPQEGAIFTPYEMFVFEKPPVREDGEEFRGPRFAFTDTSYARNRLGDNSAFTVWQVEPPGEDKHGVRKPTLGLLDVYRGRYQFPELKRLCKDVYDRYGLWCFCIEDYGSGTSLAQEFRRNAGMQIVSWRPDRDKVSRAHAATDVMADFRVRLPAADRFPSGLPVRTYLEELANFQGIADESDDMVDATTMAMILIGVKNFHGRRQLSTREFAVVG